MNKKKPFYFYLILVIVVLSLILTSSLGDDITNIIFLALALLSAAYNFDLPELWDKILGNNLKKIRLVVGILLLNVIVVIITRISNTILDTILIICFFILYFPVHGLPLNPSYYYKRLQKNRG